MVCAGCDPGLLEMETREPTAAPEKNPPEAEPQNPDPSPTDAGIRRDAGTPPRDGGTSDAGIRDAGTSSGVPDAGSPPRTDAGVGGLSLCPGSGLDLCEGFESGVIDPGVWSRTVDTGPNNFLEVTTARAARGNHSLHVSAGGASGTDVLLRTTKTFPAPGNAFYGRAYVFVQGPLPSYNFNFISATGAGGSTYDLAGNSTPFGDPSGKRIFRFHYSPGDLAYKSTVEIPTDRWDCWEWFFKGPTNELHAWLNGQEINMAIVGGVLGNPWTAPTFGQITFGMHHAHPEPESAYELWFDEIALNATRIGCNR
jgi:hypothetical protein